MSKFIIEMLGITKTFPGVTANDNVTLKLKSGEIHALLGENGAGKSTLMSILCGIYRPDKGEIKKNGKTIHLKNPADATGIGIGMVHQNFRLVDVFSVTDNIILGSEPVRFGFINKKAARKKVTHLSEKYGLKLNPDSKIENLNIGMQQKVEILKMLYRNNEIIIFDEPTSVLTPDRVTILRKGKKKATLKTSETDKNELCTLMTGKNIEATVKKNKSVSDRIQLRITDVSVKSKVHKNITAVKNASFTVKKGEILAIAGIEGNGQTELAESIAGLTKIKSGRIFICEDDVTDYSVKKRNADFVSYIPENSYRHSLIPDFTVTDNLILKRYHEAGFQHYGFMNKKSTENYAEALIAKYNIHCAENAHNLIYNLSGGNRQKTVIAREFDNSKPLIIAFEPTRGLDVTATEYVHSQIIKKRNEGHAVLLISFELDEIMKLADKIRVIYEGEISEEINAENTTLNELGLYMTGSRKGDSSHD